MVNKCAKTKYATILCASLAWQLLLAQPAMLGSTLTHGSWLAKRVHAGSDQSSDSPQPLEALRHHPPPPRPAPSELFGTAYEAGQRSAQPPENRLSSAPAQHLSPLSSVLA